MPLDTFRQTNQRNWNERTHIHAASRLYDINRYIADPHKISKVVRFDVPNLGDVSGKTLLHLQCHIGTDTLSLARLGATVTGIDFSPDAIAVAPAREKERFFYLYVPRRRDVGEQSGTTRSMCIKAVCNLDTSKYYVYLIHIDALWR